MWGWGGDVQNSPPPSEIITGGTAHLVVIGVLPKGRDYKTNITPRYDGYHVLVFAGTLMSPLLANWFYWLIIIKQPSVEYKIKWNKMKKGKT